MLRLKFVSNNYLVQRNMKHGTRLKAKVFLVLNGKAYSHIYVTEIQSAFSSKLIS